MERKQTGSSIELKAEKEGAFRATVATFLTVDKDFDVTFPNAFPVGKEIIISAYGHKSWDGVLPVGKGVLGADDKTAWVDGVFFTDTLAGADTYKTVKNLYPLGEWSYAFDTIKSVFPGEDAMKAYPSAARGLVQLDVFEASPVLLGAGQGTRTDFIKSAMSVPYADQAETVLAAVKGWVVRSQELASLRMKEGRTLSSANRERLAALMESMKTSLSDVEALLRDTEPEPKAADIEQLKAIALDVQRRLLTA